MPPMDVLPGFDWYAPVADVGGPEFPMDRGPHKTRNEVSVRDSAASNDVSVGNRVRASRAASIHVIDDDHSVREALGHLLRSVGYRVTLHPSATAFLNVDPANSPTCVILDVRLPGTSGLELQEYLQQLNVGIPVILVTGFGDVPMSVRGMKAGAIDFLTKPIREQDLLDAVAAAIRVGNTRRKDIARTTQVQAQYAQLTPRERQVVDLVASGLMNKQIAFELSIAEPTVKMHRGSAMRKLGVKSAAGLARMVGIAAMPA